MAIEDISIFVIVALAAVYLVFTLTSNSRSDKRTCTKCKLK